MPYPILAPTLAALNAVKNDPSDTESSNQLGAVDRQTRNWVHDYLAQYFDANGLKTGAFSSGGSLPTQYIRGAETTGAARELAAKTVTKFDIADAAIETALLANQSVTRDKIALKTIRAAQIDDNAITGAQIADGAIVARHFSTGGLTGAVFANSSIGAAQLAEQAVGKSNLGLRAVDGTRMVSAAAGEILVGGRVVDGEPNCLGPVKLSGALTVDPNGVATLSIGSGGGVARIAEKTSQNSPGGAATAGWNKRGVKVPWSLETNQNNIVAVNGENIFIRQDGVYLVMISAPAFQVGVHQIRAVVKPDSEAADTLTYYGTSERSGATAATQTRSLLQFVQTFKNANDPIFPSFYIEHQVGTPVGTNDLGINGNLATEYFADVQIVRLS